MAAKDTKKSPLTSSAQPPASSLFILTIPTKSSRPPPRSTTAMLSRVVRSAAATHQPAAKRAISSSASAAKSLQLHPVTTAPAQAPSMPAGVSSGELAWCEIYGLDYEQQVQEALDESPLLVSDVHRATPTLSPRATSSSSPRAAATTATSSTANAKGDIWNVVFGASTV